MEDYLYKFNYYADDDPDHQGDAYHTHVIAKNITEARRKIKDITGGTDIGFEGADIYLGEELGSKEVLKKMLTEDQEENEDSGVYDGSGDYLNI